MHSRHVLTASAALPSILPPHLVVESLQTYTPTLRHNFSITSFFHIHSDPNSIADDPFFGPWDNTIRTFYVHECTELVPGVSRRVSWPCVFQSTPNGARFRVTAPAGIKVWAEFTVRPRIESPTPSDSAVTSAINGGDDWELYDELVIEGNRIVMPFTLPYTQRVHQQICERLVDEVFRDYVNAVTP
ncbi:hypothetical protein B0T10DRAFT_519250 [Thelonectria olida]|uniref:DUF7053 domain-containing protein n=1 Tax=Thelonectria olida TaxID=1576542 RepID=A0A9P8VVZ6_9HYPO|nr:hypothetical protein B0T10DRAFT_519250 [Thelonectria olida]